MEGLNRNLQALQTALEWGVDITLFSLGAMGAAGAAVRVGSSVTRALGLYAAEEAGEEVVQRSLLIPLVSANVDDPLTQQVLIVLGGFALGAAIGRSARSLERARELIGSTRSTSAFMRYAERIIAADDMHPLRFLLSDGRLRGGRGMTHAELQADPGTVQAGHRDSSWYIGVTGEGTDRLALQWAYDNQSQGSHLERLGGASLNEPAILIGGVPVMLESANVWVGAGLLSQSVVDAALRL